MLASPPIGLPPADRSVTASPTTARALTRRFAGDAVPAIPPHPPYAADSFYSFNVASVHVVVLNPYTASGEGSKQHLWLIQVCHLSLLLETESVGPSWDVRRSPQPVH